MQIEISERDILHLEFIKNLICPDINIVTREERGKSGRMSYFTVCSKSIVENCCHHLGVSPGPKSRTVQFPKLEEELSLIFICAYFCGNGHVRNIDKSKKYPSATIYSGSLNLLKEIQEFVSIKSYINKAASIFTLDFHGKYCLEFLSKIFIDNSLSLPRKYKMFQRWMSSQNY